MKSFKEFLKEEIKKQKFAIKALFAPDIKELLQSKGYEYGLPVGASDYDSPGFIDPKGEHKIIVDKAGSGIKVSATQISNDRTLMKPMSIKNTLDIEEFKDLISKF